MNFLKQLINFRVQNILGKFKEVERGFLVLKVLSFKSGNVNYKENYVG